MGGRRSYEYMHTCMCVCVLVCMCVCMYTHARMYVCMYVCMHECMHVHDRVLVQRPYCRQHSDGIVKQCRTCIRSYCKLNRIRILLNHGTFETVQYVIYMYTYIQS